MSIFLVNSKVITAQFKEESIDGFFFRKLILYYAGLVLVCELPLPCFCDDHVAKLPKDYFDKLEAGHVGFCESCAFKHSTAFKTFVSSIIKENKNFKN
jgi:hypothetical protein